MASKKVFRWAAPLCAAAAALTLGAVAAPAALPRPGRRPRRQPRQRWRLLPFPGACTG